MKVKIKRGNFVKPRKIKIEFKDKMELELLKEVFFHNVSIPDLFWERKHLNNKHLQKLMTKINNKLNRL